MAASPSLAVRVVERKQGPVLLQVVLGPAGVEESLVQAPWKLFGPLRVPGRPPTYMVANVTAGVFGGDHLEAHLRLLPGTRARLTAPAATRVHRGLGGAWARQRLGFRIDQGAELWYWPQQLIPLAGALYRQETTFRLAQGASLVAAEVLAPGRLAMGEAFAYRSLSLSTSIYLGHELVLLDRARIRPVEGWLSHPGALAGYTYVASLYVAGEISERLAPLEPGDHQSARADTLVGCSRPHPLLWVARVLGRDLKPVLALMAELAPSLL
jgi:urease accessory protein UreH